MNHVMTATNSTARTLRIFATDPMKTIAQIYRPKHGRVPVRAGMKLYVGRNGRLEARLRAPKDGRTAIGILISPQPYYSTVELFERL